MSMGSGSTGSSIVRDDIQFPSGWEETPAETKAGDPVFHLGLHIQTLVRFTKPRWSELPPDAQSPNRSFCFETLRDVAEIADEGINEEFLKAAAEEARWDKDVLQASGKARPTLYLDAEITRPGNLIIRVRRDPKEWKDWPDCQAGPYERKWNELAFIRGARFLFRDWDSERTQNNPVARVVTQEAGYLVWATFEKCRERVGRDFDVGFQTKIEAVRAHPKAVPDKLRIVSFDELREREIQQEAAHRKIYGDVQPGAAVPEGSKLYAATPEELRRANVVSSRALLEETNRILWRLGAAAVDKSQWPTTRQKFISLAGFKSRLERTKKQEERGR